MSTELVIGLIILAASWVLLFKVDDGRKNVSSKKRP